VQGLNRALSSAHSNVAFGSDAEKSKLAPVLVVVGSGPLTIEVSGGVVSGGGSIVQACTAGEASVLPAASVARTRNSWPPIARPEYSCGGVQGLNRALSSAHSNVAFGSDAEKSKLAPVLVVVGSGPLTIVVSGAVVSAADSIVQAYSAGDGSVLPAASVARTAKVWRPSATPAKVAGLLHGVRAASSSEQAKVAASSAVKLKVALDSSVGSVGRSVIVVSGDNVSTVHAWLAGDGSVLPAVSAARTRKRCRPSSKPEKIAGLLHGANAASSREQAKVAASSAVKLNEALVALVGSAGAATIVVFGATVSTVQAYPAGDESVLPAASVACTANVWCPSARSG
jgi:hypothetical protein